MTSTALTRRRLLAATSGVAVSALAGCLGGDDDASSDGSETGGVPMLVNLDTLELHFDGNGATPSTVEVAADVQVTVAITNGSDEPHAVVQGESEFGPVTVEPGTVERLPWAVPAQPGTYRFRCQRHETDLTTVEVLAGDVGGGCPSG